MGFSPARSAVRCSGDGAQRHGGPLPQESFLKTNAGQLCVRFSVGKILRRSENTPGAPRICLYPQRLPLQVFGLGFLLFCFVFSFYFKGGGIAQNLVGSSSCGCSPVCFHSVLCPMPSSSPGRNLGGGRGRQDVTLQQLRVLPVPEGTRTATASLMLSSPPPWDACPPLWDSRGRRRRRRSSKKPRTTVQMIRSGQVQQAEIFFVCVFPKAGRSLRHPSNDTRYRSYCWEELPSELGVATRCCFQPARGAGAVTGAERPRTRAVMLHFLWQLDWIPGRPVTWLHVSERVGEGVSTKLDTGIRSPLTK